MDWSEKIVLITGASSGIGRGLALELGRRGAKLGLLARGAEVQRAARAGAGVGSSLITTESFRGEASPRLKAVGDQIEREAASRTSTRPQTMLLPADVRDYKQVRVAADRLREGFGRIG